MLSFTLGLPCELTRFVGCPLGGNQSRGEEVGDTNARMQAKMDAVTNRPTRLRGR